MPAEPTFKRTVAYFDGQNLYHAIKEAFGYTYPNYDVKALAKAICRLKQWKLDAVRFYTGVPDIRDNAFWHDWWNNKLTVMGRQVKVFSRPLRYRNKTIELPDGAQHTFLVGEEKGIDVRIALDVVRMAHRKVFDVALIFSQDQDLSEMADEVHTISIEQDRWIKVASAYPISPTYHNKRGINNTQWIPIDRDTYQACIDPRDYRSKRRRRSTP